MRTLGPRSVSSFLKVFLDISYLFLAFSLGLVALWALASVLAMVIPGFPFSESEWPNGLPVLVSTPRGAALILLFGLFVLGLLAIVGRLRKIFITLIAGQPFQAENSRRLRVIGLILAALEASRYIIWAVFSASAPEGSPFRDIPDFNFVALFGIGVMFVLAAIFDEGARMRKDLELTI
jgi:hypothetical protein